MLERYGGRSHRGSETLVVEQESAIRTGTEYPIQDRGPEGNETRGQPLKKEYLASSLPIMKQGVSP